MTAVPVAQQELDRRNADFWDELCGTTMARSLGIRDESAESLRRFDAAYLDFYPYLRSYLPVPAHIGERVLEVGVGFGTVGQLLADRGFAYHGLDIASGPVELMRRRLESLGSGDREVRLGSALDLPYPDASFDLYVSIGCLHHSGDVPRALAEARRVLRPGGRLVVMVYNARSFRQTIQLPARRLRARLRGRRLGGDHVRAAYDVNAAGESAPQTEFFSRADVRRLLAGFEDVRVESQNFDTLQFARGRLAIPRERLLGTVSRRWGLDLYVTAAKAAEQDEKEVGR
jgi:ubiquinone/menaquinone biosynthesis C-methylase UbiE